MLETYLLVDTAHMQTEIDGGNQTAEQRLALALLDHAQKRLIHHQRHITHLAWATSTMFILAVCAVWVIGNVYGTRFTLQGTMLSGANSDAQLTQLVQNKTSAYRLHIIQPNGAKQSYSLAQMGLRVNATQTIANARQQQHTLSNRLQWWRPVPLDVVTTTDSKVMADFIAKHASIAVTPAQDASISIQNGDIKITEGVAGKQYGFASPTQTIRSATAALQTTPLQMRALPLPPGITAEKLASVKKQVDATLKQKITFTIDDKEVHPQTDEIAKWVKLTPDIAHQTENLAIDRDAIAAYVQQLADDHYQAPRTQVSLGDSTIAGAYGVRVTDTDTAVNTIAQDLLKNKGLIVNLPVAKTAFKTVRAPTSGKWIEVDLTTKRMYTYTQNSLVRTFLISAGARATPTVTGTYAIYSKYTRQTMTGGNADGSHYIQPNVPWVNYFYRDYAIHGNYWRPASYFGNINSSHGCVGLRTSDAGWIYDWAPIGTPVVIHY